MIRFGAMSIVLLVGAVQGVVVAAGLVAKRSNRRADCFLAALVFLLSLKIVPYIIGYAGFYDAYPWLDLAPFDMGLGFGPLAFLYVWSLTRPELPRRWRLHLVPLALQFGLYLVLFLQPMSFKNRFESGIGTAFNRTEGALVLLSLCGYLAMAWAEYQRYERWSSQNFSWQDRPPVRRLAVTLGLFSAPLVAFVGARAWSLTVHELSYFQMFPFYVLLTASVYAFGLTAFQVSGLRFPVCVPVGVPLTLTPAATEPDWPAIARDFEFRLEASAIWQDPLLSLPTAAKALGVSESRLSRALNLGLGLSFSEWINNCRIEQVTRRLDEPRPIIEIAFECGFNSKASFNRWFRVRHNCTPTEYRKRRPQT